MTEATASTPADGRPHFPARLEDRFHRFRERRARKRGLTATAIPFTSYGAPGWIRVLSRVVLTSPGEPMAKRVGKVRGWRSFVTVPVAHPMVEIVVGGTTVTVSGDRGGVIDEVIAVPLAPGWHTIRLVTDDDETAEAPVFVADPDAKIGVISDIDDTVMVTALPRPLVAAWNTFVLDEHARVPVPGMAVLYEKLVRDHPGAPVLYLSTGAWNVAPTLTRFLERHLYPPGALLLTDWGPTHDRWFRSGREHKVGTLERLVREFPTLQWILVGDDGQHDEQLYADFAEAHPDRIAAVAIRELRSGEAVLAGGRARDDGRDRKNVPWVYAPDGAGLADQLDELGLL